MKSTITPKEWNQYLFELYFGKGDPLDNCIHRAYRDFNRTLHGFGKFKTKKATIHSAENVLKKSLLNASRLNIDSYNIFDEWHVTACIDLKKVFTDAGFNNFYIGQAQKWINMSFKYIYTYGSSQIADFENLYQYCHVPIDNILLKKLSEYNPPKLGTAWSRIDNYDTYLFFQKWFRSCAKIPMDYEFRLWSGRI